MSTAATASSATVGAAAASTSTPAKNNNIEIIPRLSKDRGMANIGWLYSYHTFSFSSYYDPNFHNFHALRVINEDRVAPSEGFGKHPHREFEIFSYVVKGALRHQDSLGNLESLGRGYVQFTSAGTGLSHSEFNDSDKEYVHFIQMWVKPNKSGLKPSYATKHWTDAEKTNQLRLILSEGGQDGSININQDCKIFASILTPGSTVEYELQPGRELYVHLIQDTTDMTHELGRTGLTVDSLKGPVSFKGGDGAFIKQAGSLPGVQKLRLTGAGVDGANAEFILFDMKKE